MQQPLMLRRNFARRRHCRDRLHAPAALRDHKAGAVIIQRPLTVDVADHDCDLSNKRCKSKRTTLRAFEVHRSPPLTGESRQISDSQALSTKILVTQYNQVSPASQHQPTCMANPRYNLSAIERGLALPFREVARIGVPILVLELDIGRQRLFPEGR